MISRPFTFAESGLLIASAFFLESSARDGCLSHARAPTVATWQFTGLLSFSLTTVCFFGVSNMSRQACRSPASDNTCLSVWSSLIFICLANR